MNYYLYTDQDVFHDEIKATSLRTALQIARERHGFVGRVRRVAYYGDTIGYKAKHGYYFEIRMVK